MSSENHHTERPAVSVVVPVYNVEHYFERCLRSLFGQTLSSLEYLFVDDCYPDGSIALLQRVLEDYPHRKGQVHVLRNDANRGCAASRARGMAAATGEYTISCDADDWVELQAYETLYAAAREHDAEIVCCGFWEETPRGAFPNHYPEACYGRVIREPDRAVFTHYYAWNKLVRTELFQRRGIYPLEAVSTWEDVSFTIPLLYFSRSTVVLPALLYHYNRFNENSMIAFKPLNLDSMIRCVDAVETFFREQQAYERFLPIVEHLKMRTKNEWLIPRRRDPARWKALYPEMNARIWQIENYPLNLKVVDWLILHGMPGLGCWLLDIKMKLVELLKKG